MEKSKESERARLSWQDSMVWEKLDRFLHKFFTIIEVIAIFFLLLILFVLLAGLGVFIAAMGIEFITRAM